MFCFCCVFICMYVLYKNHAQVETNEAIILMLLVLVLFEPLIKTINKVSAIRLQSTPHQNQIETGSFTMTSIYLKRTDIGIGHKTTTPFKLFEKMRRISAFFLKFHDNWRGAYLLLFGLISFCNFNSILFKNNCGLEFLIFFQHIQIYKHTNYILFASFQCFIEQ